METACKDGYIRARELQGEPQEILNTTEQTLNTQLTLVDQGAMDRDTATPQGITVIPLKRFADFYEEKTVTGIHYETGENRWNEPSDLEQLGKLAACVTNILEYDAVEHAERMQYALCTMGKLGLDGQTVKELLRTRLDRATTDQRSKLEKWIAHSQLCKDSSISELVQASVQ